MQTVRVNGVRIAYELTGSGDIPVVFVHGSWSSHRGWDVLGSLLSDRFRVLAFDRRGHSASERPAGQGNIGEDVDDVAALIEKLHLWPAYVVGNSYGALITLRLASTRPDLLRGIVAHEPPLVTMLAEHAEFSPMMKEIDARIAAVLKHIRSGDHAGAAERFVETVALGPGQWAQLPPEVRATFVENAPTFLDEEMDPGSRGVDLASLEAFSKPALITMGDRSPAIFPTSVRIVADALPSAEVLTIVGAGHVPHLSHPQAYAEAVTSFIEKSER